MADEHYTRDEQIPARISTPEQARAAHHLASADPEKDGLLSGVEHEEKYGLERAKATRALVEQGLATAPGGGLETATDTPAENASAPRAR